MHISLLSLLVGVACLLLTEPGFAQEDEAEDTDTLLGVDLSRADIPDTLMFTIDELNELQTRQAGGQVTGLQYRSGAIEDANLYLYSILYFTEEEWMFWVNGVAITPDFQVDTFEVVTIAPDHIELIVPLSAAGDRPVRLEPNQTFIGENGRVVEGELN